MIDPAPGTGPMRPGAAAPTPFSPVTAVGVTFRVFGRHAGLFVPVSLLLLSPAILLDAYAVVSGQPEQTAYASLFLWNVMNCVVVAALTRGTLDALDGAGPAAGSLVGIGISKGPRVLGASILASLAIVLGLFALVIPGFVAAAALYVAEPAAAVEPGTTARASLRRSWALTEGRRWGVLAVFALFQLVTLAVSFAAGTLTDGIGKGGAALAASVAGDLCVGLAVALQATAAAVTYHALRREKEGLAPPALASIFD